MKTGKVLDECISADVADSDLHRKMDKITDIRVEVEVKGPLDIFKSVGSDIVEMYSQPRVAQEATLSRVKVWIWCRAGVSISQGQTRRLGSRGTYQTPRSSRESRGSSPTSAPKS